MLVEGLRVAPQERGKGVAGVLLRFCAELVKSRYPEVKVCRLTRDDKLGPKDFEKYRIITKQVNALICPDVKWLLSHHEPFWAVCMLSMLPFLSPGNPADALQS